MELKFEGTGVVNRVEIFTTKSGKKIKTLVLETGDKYPQLVPVKLAGKSSEYEYSKGDTVEVTGYLGGRDYNGRVFGDIKAVFVKVVGTADVGAKEESPQEDDSSDVHF